MFIDKSLGLFSVSRFSPTNFITRCLNQLFVFGIFAMFIESKSFYCCVLALLTLIFNVLNFKIRFEKNPQLGFVLRTQNDFALTCQSRELIIFKYYFWFCLTFLIFKLSIVVAEPIADKMSEQYKPFITQMSHFYYQTSYLFIPGPTDFKTDTIFLVLLTLLAFAFYVANKKTTIYYDYYTVRIYQTVFNNFTKYATLLASLVILLLKEVIYFKLNVFGFIENMIIVVILIRLFFRFKVGNYKNLKKYINILKYLALFKIVLFVMLEASVKIFNLRIDSPIIAMLTSEIEHQQLSKTTRFSLLVLLYYLYNFTNFNIKFQNLFVLKNIHPYFGTLQSKPYKLQFISYFAKNLLSILKVKDIKKAVKHNLDLRYKFYKQLKKYTYFRKSFEYSFKSSSLPDVLSRKYTFYEAWIKYLNIFDIYKYDLCGILLNGLMFVYLASSLFEVNILSIFYMTLALIIMTSNQFKVIWYSSMAFCILPCFFFLIFFMISKIAHVFKMASWYNEIDTIISHLGFSFQLAKTELAFHRLFLMLMVNLTYIICIMFIKNRGYGIKRQYTILENLRNRRMIIIDADEDILFLVTSLCRFILLGVKYFLVFVVCKESLSFVNITNSLVLLAVFIFFLTDSELGFDILTNAILFIFVVKFFARFAMIFSSFDDTESIFYGLYFSNTTLTGIKDLLTILKNQKSLFYWNFGLIYIFFVVKSLLQRTQTNKFLQNKNFKTKYLSIVYNNFVDLVKHSKNVIDSTKIFFVYFILFYLCINSPLSKFNLIEFVYINIVLIYHMVLFKKQGNVKSWTFFSLFCLYFTYIFGLFAFEYTACFDFFKPNSLIPELENYIEMYNKNYEVLYPFAVRILLTLISLNSIHAEHKDHVERLESRTPSTAVIAVDVKDKFYYEFLKIISVFLKEILLFYTCFRFLQKPNIFKFLYLLCYMYYFTSQIKTLAKVFEKFYFVQIIQAKILFYKHCLLNTNFKLTDPGQETRLFGSFFETLNMAYYRLMTKTIFNKIHKQVYTTWIWMFGVVIIYLQLIFLLQFIYKTPSSEGRIFFWLFNLKGYTSDDIKSEFFEATIVLIVTIFEIYFIDILKSQKMRAEKEVVRSVSCAILLRYKHIFAGNEEVEKTWKSTIDESIRITDFDVLMDDFKSMEFKEEEFKFSKLRTSELPEGIDKVITNLNCAMSLTEKYILLNHNRSKLSFLQVMIGSLSFLKRLIVLPLIVGVLLRKNTAFGFALIALLYLFYSKGNYFKMLRRVNQVLVLVCLVEYAFIFLFNKAELGINSDISSIEYKAVQLREHTLSGLPFVFLYTAFIKGFFMCTILMCKFGIVEIDKVYISLFEKVRNRIIGGIQYAMIDYKFWGRDNYFMFYQMKKIALSTIANIFFMVSLIAYYHTSGLLTYLALLTLMLFKLTFTFYLQKPFGLSAVANWAYYYAILSYMNFAVIFCFQIPVDNMLLTVSINNKVLYGLMIILNFVVIDCAQNEECQVEKASAEKYYSIRNQLGILGLVYAQNEMNIVEMVDMEVKNKYLQSQYYRHDTASSRHVFKRGLKEFSQVSIRSVSMFSSNKSYKQFLLEQFNVIMNIVMGLQLWIRRKLLENNSASSNLLSLFSSYLYKNQPFMKDGYSFDFLKLNQGDYSQLEEIMKEIELNKADKFANSEQRFVSEIKERIQEFEEPVIINRNRNTTIGLSSTLNQTSSKINVASANLFLLKELTVDRMAMQLKETPNLNFGENFYKFNINDKQTFVLRNFDQISSELSDIRLVDLGFKEYVKWVFFLLWVRFELIMNLLLIVMLCFGQGFMTTIYIMILIFLILIENRFKNLRYWEIFYLVFMINMIVQLFLSSRYKLIEYSQVFKDAPIAFPSESVASIALFFYGKIDQDYLVVIFIFLEIILMHLCDNSEIEKTVLEIESHAQAIMRVSMHPRSWQYVFNRVNGIHVSEIDIIEKKLKEKYKARLNEKEYTIFLVNLIKRKSAIYKSFKEKFCLFMYHLEMILPNFKQDLSAIRPQHFKDYLWRNFAYPLRKCGRNFHSYQLLTLLMMMTYFVVFFFKMQGVDKTVIDIFKNNEIHGTLSINISIILLAICFERYMHSQTALYWIYCTDNEGDIALRQIKFLSLDQNQAPVLHVTSVSKFRKAVRKCIMLLRWRTPSDPNLADTYKHNPLLLKFYFAVAMWIYISVLAMVWIPMVSNQQISTGLLKKVFCNEIYRTEENPNNPTSVCNNFSNNIYLQLLFLIGSIYLVVAITQIRRGTSRFTNYKEKNYKRVKTILQFYAYKYTPFFRELKIVIDYTASKTSLNLFQWFKLEDIETTIMSAKNNEFSNTYTGKRLDKIIKRVIGLSFIAFFFLLLVAPLYLFSDMLPNNIINEVKSAKIRVMAMTHSGNFLLYSNTGCTIEKLTRYNKLVELAKQQNECFKKFDTELFRKLSFGSSSESYFDITYEMAEYILKEYKSSRTLAIIIDLQLDTSYRGSLSAKFDFDLDDENAMIFLTTLSASRCSDLIKSKMILGQGPKVIKLRDQFSKGKNRIFDGESGLQNMYLFNFKCEPDTDKITFELLDEDSQKIEFLVLSENINNSVDLLQKYTASDVSLLSVYVIIFSYIGLTIIRKAFFDQAHIIWTTEMPNAHKLQEHIYMINYARQQGDLVSEQTFFYKLIDLFRAPEKIKKLTGPLFDSAALKSKS